MSSTTAAFVTSKPTARTTVPGGTYTMGDFAVPLVVRHGLRTLVKKGDLGALTLVDFSGSDLEVGRPMVTTSTVPWDGSVTFSATVTNRGRSEARVAVDYSIGFRRGNGKHQPEDLQAGYADHPALTDDRGGVDPLVPPDHHPSLLPRRAHTVTAQANGVVSDEVCFSLERPPD